MSSAGMALLTGLTTGLLVVAMRVRMTPRGRPVGLRDGLLAFILMIWVGISVGTLAQSLVAPDASEPPFIVVVVATAIAGIAAAAFGLVRVVAADERVRFGLVGAKRGWWLLAVALVPAFVVVSVAWSALLVGLGEDVQPQVLVSRIAEDPTSPASIIALAYGAFVAPFIEELVFRALLLNPLADRIGAGAAVLATALLFGLMHLADPLSVPPLVLFGVLLAVLRLRSGSLGPPVLLHIGNNLLAFTLALWGLG